MVSGKVISKEKQEVVDFATVYLKGTTCLLYTSAKLKVTIRAEVNMFMKAMVAKPLQDGVDKLAEMLSMIPY